MHPVTTARLLAAGAAIALTSPALAQDTMTADDFSGFYIAGSVGAAVQNNDNNDTVVFDTNLDGDFDDVVRTPTNPNAFSPGFCSGRVLGDLGSTQLPRGPRNGGPGCVDDDDDVEYAVKIGYDQQIGSNFVAGVLLEGSMTDAEDFTTAFSTTPASYSFNRKLDYAISARGRFGYTPGGRGMFYVTGGPSYAKLDHEFNTSNTVNTFSQEGGNKVWGYQFGGGAEFTLASGLGLGLEYLYSEYDDEDYFVAIGRCTAVGAGCTVVTPNTNAFVQANTNGTNFRPSDNDFNYHSLRVNLIYKFGRGAF